MADLRAKRREIVQKYGHELSIGYYYYSYNPIEYIGEEQVRKSFDSVKKYGKRVYIGDYSSNDGVKELVEEYGFTFLNIPRTKDMFFHESKIANKIIFEMKENFMCYLNFWCYYPDNLEDYILKWLKTHNGMDTYLKMVGYASSVDGKFVKSKFGATHVSAHVFYRPFLYEARGYDERTSYHSGTRNYAIGLMQRVLRLKRDAKFFPFTHIFHQNIYWNKIPVPKRRKGLDIAEERISKLSQNFNRETKNVKNSYW